MVKFCIDTSTLPTRRRFSKSPPCIFPICLNSTPIFSRTPVKINNKFFRVCCLRVATFSISSCDNYFDLERPIQFPWQNASELELAVREGYLHMSNDPWFNPMGALTMVDFGQSDVARLL